MNSRDKRLERAQTRVIFTVPFFAPGVAKLPVVWDKSIPTACTAGETIRWNPDWFDSLDDHVLPTVLCHETAHCLLGHVWRAPEGADWELWNQACDHAVNLMLKDFAAQVTAKGLADPFPFPKPEEAYCANPAFRGLAEENIYARLSSSKTPQPTPNPSGKPGKGPGGGKGPSPGQKPQGGAGQGQGAPSKGSMPSFGQIEKPVAGQGPKGKAASDWDNTLIQSVKMAQGQGSVPAGLERLVDGLVHPVVPWWEILRSWLRQQAFDDWDFMHPAPEYDETGFVLPSLRSEKMGPIIFATDTSGSIDETLLKQFQSEKQSCLDEMRPSRIVDIYCDSAIHKVAEYRPGETIAKDAPGGGGTDFRPVFDHVAKLQAGEDVKAIVYLTDLYGRFPEADPGVPVIWVTWTKDGKAPFGEVVYAGKD